MSKARTGPTQPADSSEPAAAGSVMSHGSVKVLVVDDEVALLQLMQRYLARIGYEVEISANSRSALELVIAEPDRFQLVVADLSMPQLSGRELVVRIGEINPSIAILVCSGEPFDCESIPHPDSSRLRFLQKPFAPQMLANAVSEIVPVSKPVGA